MIDPILFFGAIRQRADDGSRTDEAGEPEWFVEVNGKWYRLAPALTCPAIPYEWIKHVSFEKLYHDTIDVSEISDSDLP